MRKKKFFAQAQPKGAKHQMSDDSESSFKIYHFPQQKSGGEQAPHGAGSYHNPEHHYDLIERVENYLREQS